MAEGDLGALGAALIEVRADLATLKTDLDKAKVLFENGTKDIQKSANDLGKQITLAFGVPLTAAGAALILVGKQFDEAFDDIRASTGKTGDALAGLTASFKTVFGNVPNDAKDVTAAIVQLNQRLGLSGEALDTMATQFLNLSRVGKTELGPIIESSTKLFGAWQVATSQQSETLDMLFRASQQTGVNIGTLTQTLAQTAPVFKQFGFDLSTSAALLAQWQKNGIAAETVTGSLRIAVAKFAKDGVDAGVGLKAVVDRMRELGPGAAQTKLAIDTFGRGAVAMADAINRGAFSVEGLVNSIRNGRETINQAAFDTLSFADKWKVLRHNIDLAIEPLGSSLLNVLQRGIPLLQGAASGVKFLAEGFSFLPASVQIATFGIGGFFAALGPGLYIADKFSGSFTAISKAMTLLGNTIPVLTARIWLLEAAEAAAATTMGTFVVASAPVIVAVAGVTAAVTIGYQAWKLYSESKERAAAQTRQDVIDAGHLERMNTLLGTSYTKLADAYEEANKRRAAAVPSGPAGPSTDGVAALQASLAALDAKIADLSTTRRAQLVAMLKDGSVGTAQLATAFDLSEAAIERFKQKLATTDQLFKASSIGKFTTDLKTLTEQVHAASEATDLQLFLAFAEESAKIVDRATTMADGLKKVPPEIIALGQAWDRQQLAKKMDELAAHAQKSLQETLKANAEIGEALMKRVADAAELTKGFADKLALATMTGLQRTMAEIDQQQDAALKQLGDAPSDPELMAGWAKMRDTIVAYFGDMRAAAMKFTGDVVRDAEMRGQKTKEMLIDEAAREQAHLENMLRHRELFTDAVIEQQEQLAKNAKKAAEGTLFEWRESLSKMAQAWSQLGSVAGGTLGQIAVGIGTAITAADTMSKSLSESSKGFRAGGFSGIMTGISGLVSAAGAAIEIGKKMWDAFTKSPGEDVQHRVSTDWGVKIGEQLGDQIAKTAKEQFARSGGLQAAEIFHFSDILSAAGGLTEKNFSQMTARLRDVFVMVGTGAFTAAQGAKVLDENFTKFVTAATSNMGVLSARIVEFVKLNREAGTQSVEIAKFVQGQITGNIFGGLTKALTVGSAALESYDALNKKQMDLRAEMAKTTDPKALKDLQQQLDATMTELNKVGPLFDATKVQSQEAASAMAGAILAGIGELQNTGVSFVAALREAEPAIAALQAQLTATGLSGGDAFEQLRQYVELANDEIAGPALEAVAGFGQALVGLNNSGLLTQDMFIGLSSQIAKTRENLIAQGKDGGQVLRLMAPQLQQIWEIQRQTGMAVDESTQALLDEAQAAGLVGEKFMGPQQQMIEALNKTNDILTGIAKFFGVTLPDAAAHGAGRVRDELGRIPRDITVGVEFDVAPTPTFNPTEGDQTQFAAKGGIIRGGVQYFTTSGVARPMRPRGTDTVPAMLTPGELVLNIAQQQNLAGALTRQSDQEGMGGQPVEQHLQIQVQIGENSLGTFTERVTWPDLKALWLANRRGSRTDARAVLDIK